MGTDVKRIGGQLLKQMIIAGADRLEEHKQLVDSLNVFPIPDGDTGTNMSMTVMAAARELLPVMSDRIGEVAKHAAGGALKGARGNSGVILSQLFRGFARSLEGMETAGCDELADAFAKASETAYKAVMKPKEGTMLTVARVMAEAAGDYALDYDDIPGLCDFVFKAGHEVLKKTPDMLPVLKQANVVDSGGMGILFIFEGACAAVGGEPLAVQPDLFEAPAAPFAALERVGAGDMEFIYCTEFFIHAAQAAEEAEVQLLSFYESIGDSTLVVGDGELIKVHVHTNNPGDVLEAALRHGSLSNIKIDNMLIQHTSLVNGVPHAAAPVGPQKEIGFIAVSAGEGFMELFLHLEVDRIIEGGQTMNPSAEDFINAVRMVNAEHIIILPNNKNIIMAAKQAADMMPDRLISVLDTRSIPQGLAAMIGYTPDLNAERNVSKMAEAASVVVTGHVTRAVRDSNYNGQSISEGDMLSLLEDDIIAVSTDAETAARKLIDAMTADDSAELISVYYGDGANEEQAERLREYIDEHYPGRETEVRAGGQPVYCFTVSAE